LAVGLFYKLLLGPAIVALLFIVILGARGPVIQVTIFETAMAPMITGSIVAVEHNLDPSLSSLMVGVGIPLSFLTLPLWWWILAPV
ncbi:MAG TPA: transporter, partial [Synergistaceae bacterium]|nr:transporter [Synergistaceae bacterium]